MAEFESNLIAMADIARMAGVGRATVGNWKARRPDDFPPERGRTARGPLYDSTEVASWLATRRTSQPTKSGSRPAQQGINEDLWRVIEAIRGTWRLHDAAPVLLYALSRAIAETNGHLDAVTAKVDALDSDLESQLAQLRGDAPDELGALLGAVRASDAPLAFVWNASNLLASVGRHWDFGTPAPVADFIAGLVGPATTIYDPAIGGGQLATRVAQTTDSDVTVYGQDLNPVAAALATSLLEAAGFDSQIRLGNTVADDQHEDLLAEVVVAHPPFGVQHDQDSVDPDDIRWLFGLPRGDTAWLQIGLHHLAPGGRMAILVPPRMLFQQGSEGGIIQRVVRRNLLRAVIALPERSLAPSAVAPALLLLGEGWGTTAAASDHRILMVDDEEWRDPSSRRQTSMTEDSVSRVIDTVRAWLDRGQEPESVNANLVTYEDIIGNDWVLLPHRYRPRTRATFTYMGIDQVREEARTNLSEIVSKLTERVQQYVERSYETNRSTGVLTTLGALDDVTFIAGVAAQDVLEGGPIEVIEPADLKGIPVSLRFWDGERGTLLEAGDVLVKLVSPNLGDSALFTDNGDWGSCVAAPGVGVIRAGKLATITAEYLAAWFASPAFQRDVERLAVGSTRKRLRFADLAAITIAVPDHEAQQVLGERARSVAEIERLLPQLEFDLDNFAREELSDIVKSVEPEKSDGH
jgi:type I restriction-modification system DNA methylase subunit